MSRRHFSEWSPGRALAGQGTLSMSLINTMEREDILKFTNAVILLSKLFMTTDDRFLKQKLHNKIYDFVSAFVEQKSIHSSTSHNLGFRNTESIAKSGDIVQRSSSVAQYRQLDLINSINNLIDYLEHLAHTSKNNTTPLFVAQRSILKFKLHILKQIKTEPSTRGNTPEEKPKPAVDPTAQNLPAKPRPKPVKPELKANSNKERIFNFVKMSRDVRAKDIMSEFSALSDRTVKRNLKELTNDGLLKRERLEGGAVHYFIT